MNCCISLSCLPSGLQSCFQAIWSFPLVRKLIFLGMVCAVSVCPTYHCVPTYLLICLIHNTAFVSWKTKERYCKWLTPNNPKMKKESVLIGAQRCDFFNQSFQNQNLVVSSCYLWLKIHSKHSLKRCSALKKNCHRYNCCLRIMKLCFANLANFVSTLFPL